MIAVVETHRGVDILRDEPTARGPAGRLSELAEPIVRYHAFLGGAKFAADSLEGVRLLIDSAIGASPGPSAG